MTSDELNPSNFDLTPEQRNNLPILAEKITDFENLVGKKFTVTQHGGVRTPELQMQVNPRNPKSNHTKGAAGDFADVDGSIYEYAIENYDLMIRLGLWFEQKTYTPSWIHCQIFAPKSGRRFFIP